MSNNKHVLQKVSLAAAAVSFALAIVSGILLYFKVQSVGTSHPMSASYMASVFFFLSVGFVLTVVGKTNLPSFKVEDSEPD